VEKNRGVKNEKVLNGVFLNGSRDFDKDTKPKKSVETYNDQLL